MDVVVISLRSATDRRRATSKHLGALPVDYEFFDAISGTVASRNAMQRVDARAYRLNACRDPVPGELGCYESHRGVWQLAVERGRPLVVLEDDFMPLPGFERSLVTLDRLMHECDFVRLEPVRRRRRAPLKRCRPIAYRLRAIGGFELLYLSDVPACLTGYAISPRGAARLLKASRTIVAPIDKFVQRTWVHGVAVHALSPPIVRSSALATQSTIGSRKHLKRRDPLLLLERLLGKGLGELRRLKFDRQQLARGTPSRILEGSTLAALKQ
jgi:glycosyl transferase family 25